MDDFNTAAFTVEFPANEGAPSPTLTQSAPVAIVDDALNEAEEQYFIVCFEIVHAVNRDSLDIDRDVAAVVIGNNDGKYNNATIYVVA